MSQSDSVRPRQKRQIGCLPLGIVCVLTLAGVVFGSIAVWRMAGAKQLQAAIEQLKAAGHPTNKAELRATYPAEGTDLGDLWVKAGNSFSETATEYKRVPFIGAEAGDAVPPGEKWDQLEPSKEYLRENAAALASLAEVSQMAGTVRYKQDLVVTNPADFQSATPYMQSHRAICRAMSVACYVHGHESNPEGVVNSIAIGLRSADSLSNEPKVIGQLISTACTSMMINRINEFIAMDLSDAQLEELQRLLRDMDPFRSYVLGLEGEAVQAIESYQDPRMTGLIVRYEDAALAVEELTKLLAAADNKSWRKIRQAAELADRSVEQLHQTPTGVARFALAMNLLPSTTRFAVALNRQSALLQVADALCACRRFQKAEGRFPTDWEELVPEYLPQLPEDPFSDTQEALRMLHHEDELVIYSLGMNCTDDGGSTEFTERGLQVDIVVTLPRQ